jgi:hypothetical protein
LIFHEELTTNSMGTASDSVPGTASTGGTSRTQEQALDADPEILNVGLDLAMEWGADFMQPIHPRLSRCYPQLAADELDAYDAACRTAMGWGHLHVAPHWHAAGGNEREARRAFEQSARGRYPWISDKNLSRLYAQGRYYAWHDGELG